MTIYQIIVGGVVDQDWSDWFNGMEITTRNDRDTGRVTIFTGYVIDQAALRGILNHLWDLNLVILSVSRVVSIQGTERQ